MAKVDFEELIDRVMKRVRWLDQKCELYDGEVLIQLKIIDQFNKTLASLLKLLQFNLLNGEDPRDELMKLFAEEYDGLVQ